MSKRWYLIEKNFSEIVPFGTKKAAVEALEAKNLSGLRLISASSGDYRYESNTLSYAIRTFSETEFKQLKVIPAKPSRILPRLHSVYITGKPVYNVWALNSEQAKKKARQRFGNVSILNVRAN